MNGNILNLEQLIEKFGNQGVWFEQNLYKISDHYSENYKGGSWKSVKFVNELEEEGFYLTLENQTTYKIRNCQNQFLSLDAEMNSKTFALAMFSMTLSLCSNSVHENEGFSAFQQELTKMYHFANGNAKEILDNEEDLSLFYKFLD